MHVFFCFGRFDFKPVMVIKWCLCSNSFQAESKSPCTPVLAVPNTIIIWNYVGLFRPDSELGHATVCYKCIRTHTLFDVRWNLNIYIYMFVACNRWVRIKKEQRSLSLSIRRLYPHHLRPAEDDVSDRPQVTSRRQQVPTDHPQDFGVETCWSQASAMSRCGHVFTVLIFLFFLALEFLYVWACGSCISLSLSLSLSCSLSLPLPYLYLYIYLLYVSYIYMLSTYQIKHHSIQWVRDKSYLTSSDPTLTHYSDIVSDKVLEVYVWNLFWHSIWHYFWHSIWHLVWHSVWHTFWNLFWHTFWHLFWPYFWHLLWHSIWHLFWLSFWHSFWQILWHSFLAFYLASILTFYLGILTGRRSRAPLHSGLAIWLGSIGAHSHAEIRRAGRGVDDRKEKEGRKGRKELHLY